MFVYRRLLHELISTTRYTMSCIIMLNFNQMETLIDNESKSENVNFFPWVRCTHWWQSCSTSHEALCGQIKKFVGNNKFSVYILKWYCVVNKKSYYSRSFAAYIFSWENWQPHLFKQFTTGKFKDSIAEEGMATMAAIQIKITIC